MVWEVLILIFSDAERKSGMRFVFRKMSHKFIIDKVFSPAGLGATAFKILAEIISNGIDLKSDISVFV